MAQATLIDLRFGLSVSLRNEVEPNKLQEMEHVLKDELRTKGIALPPNAQIYVKELRIRTKQAHFGVSDITKRLDFLQVSASLVAKARASGKIAIHDIGIQTNPSIRVITTPTRVSYTLPSSYVAEHNEYTDYLAVIVKPGCPMKLRELDVKIAAQATPEYAHRLRNNAEGRVISKLRFQLARDIQLTLAL